ncbi:hypothetical protein ACQWTT_001250 [Acinetobacter baumannii]
MSKKNEIFPDDFLQLKKNQQVEIKSKNKDLLSYYVRLSLEKEPTLTTLQSKAKGLETFLNRGGIQLICIDSYVGDITGISLCELSSRKEIFFIKNNSVLINIIYELYYSGKFSEYGGPDPENLQNVFIF